MNPELMAQWVAAVRAPHRPEDFDKDALLPCGWCYRENGEEVHPHPECKEEPNG